MNSGEEWINGLRHFNKQLSKLEKKKKKWKNTAIEIKIHQKESRVPWMIQRNRSAS